MKRNSIRVVCNPYTNKMSYYFKNEIGEWDVLSSNSPLSRQYYTNTSISERANEILTKIDEIYNRKNKGIDILFEGTSENYKRINEIVNSNFKGRDITCKLGTTRIAVVGKKAVGKTFLIEGMENLQGFKYQKKSTDFFDKYSDECNHAEWFEVAGIDLGKKEIEKAFDTIKKLSEEGLSAVVYCIAASSGRIEDIEKEFIKRIAEDFLELKVMIVLTQCFKEDIQDAIDEIEKITDQIKLVPVLARDYKTGLKNEDGEASIIPSFGLQEVSQFVFEGR